MCSEQHIATMYTNAQTRIRKTGTIIERSNCLLLANTYVVDHRPLHCGNRARNRLPIASTRRREPRTPRMDERAVARRVPRVPEDVDSDDGGSPAKSVHTLVIPDSPTTMREGSSWTRLALTLRRFLIGR